MTPLLASPCQAARGSRSSESGSREARWALKDRLAWAPEEGVGVLTEARAPGLNAEGRTPDSTPKIPHFLTETADIAVLQA